MELEDRDRGDHNNENRLDDLLPTPPRMTNQNKTPPSSSIQPPVKRMVRTATDHNIFNSTPPDTETNIAEADDATANDDEHLNLFYNTPENLENDYPDLSQLKLEIQAAQNLFRNCNNDWKILIEQKHKLTIIIVGSYWCYYKFQCRAS